MTLLPRLGQARGTNDEMTTRQWKRVKRLENNLGFSNLVSELLPSGRNLERERHTLYCTDGEQTYSQRRKRRLSALGTLNRIRGSTPQPIAAIPSPTNEEQSLRWTQPVGQQHSILRGNLPRMGRPLCEPASRVEPIELSSNRAVDAHLSAQQLGDSRGKSSQEPTTGSTRPGDFACLQASGEWTPCQTFEIPLSFPRQKHESINTSAVGISLDAKFTIQVDAPLKRHSCDEGQSQTLGAGGGGGGVPPSCRDVQTKQRLIGRNSNLEQVGCIEGDKSDITSTKEGTRGSARPRVIVVQRASRLKLCTMWSGSSRSLTPKNSLYSSTPVAQVNEDLQRGGEQRPKALLVSSGTFNPVHKLHIRRFHLAKDFLEAELGVSAVGLLQRSMTYENGLTKNDVHFGLPNC